MTTDKSQGSLNLREASPSSSIATPLIHTPPSESSAIENNLPQRRPSPLNLSLRGSKPQLPASGEIKYTGLHAPKPFDNDEDSGDEEMPERPPMHRPTDGRSEQPLLKEEERGRSSYDSPSGSARPAFVARRSTFRSRSPDLAAQNDTKRKYTYAAFFLVLSLISFVVQTETAVYIQDKLGWKKAYCMLSVSLFRRSSHGNSGLMLGCNI